MVKQQLANQRSKIIVKKDSNLKKWIFQIYKKFNLNLNLKKKIFFENIEYFFSARKKLGW